MNLKKLQNGSDIRGVAVDGVIGESVTINDEIVSLLARGFLTYLRKKYNKNNIKIAIGHDSRISCDHLKNAIIKGLSDDGAHVIDCGLASTPSMFMSTLFTDFKTDGAIMITASHLPYNRNGMKFFDLDGGLNKGDISALIDYAQNKQFETFDNGVIEKADLIGAYSDFLINLIRSEVNHPTNYKLPLKGMKIVVDAGNGAGGFYATRVLDKLGANTQGSQFLEPDGMFPNHIPNPEDKAAMKSISDAVIKNGADFGLIFDTDVDRSSAVDKNGCEISRNAIVAMAAALICEKYPNTTVVTDSVTSDELHDFLENSLKVKHLRFKRGYKNVINESMRLNEIGIDSQLAIETSGHAAFKENHFLDDGAYLATKIVIKAAMMYLENRKIDELISDLKHPLQSNELRFKINCEDFKQYGENVLQHLFDYASKHDDFNVAQYNFEGIRISFDEKNGNGWCLLRQSLHDPIMPFNVESNDELGCINIAIKLYEILKDFEHLDISTLNKFINN